MVATYLYLTFFGRCRSVSDRFGTVSERFRIVSDRFGRGFSLFFKFQIDNWLGLGPRGAEPAMASVSRLEPDTLSKVSGVAPTMVPLFGV